MFRTANLKKQIRIIGAIQLISDSNKERRTQTTYQPRRIGCG